MATGEAAKMSAREQIKMALTDMGRRTWSSAKSFGRIAVIYSAAECSIESVKNMSLFMFLCISTVLNMIFGIQSVLGPSLVPSSPSRVDIIIRYY